MDPQNTDLSTPPAQPQPPVQSATPPPTAPQQPQPMPSYGGATPQPGSGPNKKLIIGLVAGGVGLLVLIIIVIVVASLMSVSKKDYQAALSQYSEVSSANSTLTSKVSMLQYSLSSGTDTSFDNDIDAAKKAVTELKEENEELAKLKAVKVGDGKEKYEAFTSKVDAYTKFADNLLISLQDVRTAVQKCSSADTTSSGAAMASINNCIAELEKVGNTPDPDIKEFMSKMKDEYKNLAAVLQKLSAIKDPYGKQYEQYKSLRDQTYKIIDNVTGAQTDFRSNLEKHADEVDPKDSAKDLSDFLTDKSLKR